VTSHQFSAPEADEAQDSVEEYKQQLLKNSNIKSPFGGPTILIPTKVGEEREREEPNDQTQYIEENDQ